MLNPAAVSTQGQRYLFGCKLNCIVLQNCGQTLVQIPDYIQIVGIILGMCTLGYLGDKIGRKWGSVFTASLMLIGAILLTATDAPTDKGFVIFYIISQVNSFPAASASDTSNVSSEPFLLCVPLECA